MSWQFGAFNDFSELFNTSVFQHFPVLGRLEPWVVPEHPNQFPLISGNSFGFSSRFLAKCGHIQITCTCNQLK